MKPKISEAAFDVLITQTGLPLSPEQKQALYDRTPWWKPWCCLSPSRCHARPSRR